MLAILVQNNSSENYYIETVLDKSDLGGKERIPPDQVLASRRTEQHGFGT